MADEQADVPWYETFDDVFWLTIASSFFAFLAVMLRACLKSRCTSISMCGLECHRDLSKEVDTNDIKLDIEPSKAPPNTPRSMSDFSEIQEGRELSQVE
jgi:hypothetical protein